MNANATAARSTSCAAFVEVSPEMTTLLGPGLAGLAPVPPDPVALKFDLGAGGRPPSVRIDPTPAPGAPVSKATPLVLLVERAAFRRIGGPVPSRSAVAGLYLPSELRSIAVALCQCPMSGEARTVYQLAKSIELLCETIRLLNEGHPVPLMGSGGLSMYDSRRLHEARRMIDEKWSQKLTIGSIARACGLNRAKLTSGFRDLFGCSVARALAEKRLEQARKMLLTTDLPVSSIGYENGYLNNASFARAFSRRYGLSPSSFRACGTAA